MKLKKLLNVVRAANGTPDKHFTSAIIAAAGLSTRFGDENKQAVSILDVPVLIHTLRAYDASDCIDEIIIVTKKEDVELWREQCDLFSIKKVKGIVEGGKTRQESVMCGLEAISDKAKYVAIADGARCLVTPAQITKVCLMAYRTQAACAAHLISDTVKRATAIGNVKETVDRTGLWQVQTPQVFHTTLYHAALAKAEADDFTVTDDASLVEHLGYSVRLVECGRANIKLTTPADLPLAQAILNYRAGKKK